jgi:hypothetical protein
MPYPRITPTMMDGKELFHDGKVALSFSISDFWRWSVSDLVSNATRGILAEFIVANALEVPFGNIRDEWAAWDLTTIDGIKVEVKSAAYIQSWYQKELSPISFGVKKRKAWNPELEMQEETPIRHADVYVFALLSCKDQSIIDPLDVGQWEFYVLPTAVLNSRERSQHSISLQSLQKLCLPLKYNSIKTAVEESINGNI